MSNNELLLNIYKMAEKQGCLVFKSTGKLYKISNLIDVLSFVGEMKLLSIAIDTGAVQNYSHTLQGANGLECLLKCSFVQEVVALEICFKQQLRFSWQGTAKEFRTAVDRMIIRMPPFF